MTKKFYRISDLINDYIKLKEELEKTKKDNSKNIVWLLEMLFPETKYKQVEIKGLNINRLIEGYKNV